ncbi:HEPN domain-containing protein [Bacillus cereus]|nr:HEPN domain-containing protein [Bacillus cereus]
MPTFDKKEYREKLIALKSSMGLIITDEYNMTFYRSDLTPLYTTSDNFKKIGECVEYLSSISSAIRRAYTNEYFMEQVTSLLYEALSENKEINEEDVSKQIGELQKNHDKEWKVTRKVNGIDLEGETKELKLGAFTLFQFGGDGCQLDLVLGEGYREELEDCFKCDTTVLATIDIKAGHVKGAIELADQEFEKLELLLIYLIRNAGIGKYNRVSIISADRLGYAAPTFLVDNEKKGEIDRGTTGILQIPYNLNNVSTSLMNRFYGHANLIKIFNSDMRTKFQDSILDAVFWVSKAISDHDKTRSFVQLSFALECLFSGGSGISISAALSSSAAWLLGSDYDSRVAIADKVIELYGVRSSIVHGSASSVDESTLEEMEKVVRDMLAVVLKDDSEELYNLESKDDFHKWIKKKQFSLS